MSEIDHAISESTGITFRNQSNSSIGGGCISSITNHRRGWSPILSQKNQPSFLPFFEAEAQALTEIKNTKTVRVPEVIAHGVENAQAYLVLEYIEEEEIHLLDRRTRHPTG